MTDPASYVEIEAVANFLRVTPEKVLFESKNQEALDRHLQFSVSSGHIIFIDSNHTPNSLDYPISNDWSSIVTLQHLTELHISSQGDKSTFEHIAKLPFLSRLSINAWDFYKNPLETNLPQIRHLLIEDCDIPNEDEFFQHFPNLLSLKIYTILNETPDLSKHRIHELQMNYCNLQTIDSKKLPKSLIYLSAFNNKIKQFLAEKDFPILKYLNLSKNPIEYVDLRGCLNLRTLLIKSTLISELPEGVAYCHKLEEIDLRQNKSISRLDSWGTYPFLKRINLSKCNISKLPDFSKCPHLTHIYASKNKIQQMPISLIHTSIQYLKLDDNELEFIPKFITNLKKLVELSIFENPIKIPLYLDPSSKINIDYFLCPLATLKEIIFEQDKDIVCNLIAEEYRFNLPKIIQSLMRRGRNSQIFEYYQLSMSIITKKVSKYQKLSYIEQLWILNELPFGMQRVISHKIETYQHIIPFLKNKFRLKNKFDIML